jgi:AsmA protein
MPPRRRRQAFPIYPILRIVVVLLFLAAVAGALALVAAFLLIDPDSHKAEIEAAVLQSTGRTLQLRGPLRLAFGLPPSLVAEDIVLSNPPGASRPQMMTLERAEARVALWPLLSGNLDLADVTLIHPDVMLERDGNGLGNWVMTPAGAAATPVASAAAVPANGQIPPPPVSQLAMARPARARVAVQSVHIEGGRIGWRPRPGAATAEILLPHVDATAGSLGGTMMLAGTVSSAGRALRLSGEVGSLARLFERNVQLPWPVNLTLQDQALRVSVSGSIAQPTRAEGMSLLLEAAITDFSGIEAFLPPDLPPPHEANVSVRWGDGTIAGGNGLQGMNVHLGGLKLPRLLPGVELLHVDVAAPGLDRPVHVDIEGSNPAIGPLRFVLNAAVLSGLLPGAHPTDPVPVDATLDAGRALISVKGTVAEPSALKGVDLDAFVRLPDLAAFSAAVGRNLPPLDQVAFEGHLIGDLNGTGAVAIRKGTVTLPEAQFAGDADIRLGARPSVHAEISSQRIDLDAMISDLSVLWTPGETPDPTAAIDPTAPVPAPPPLPASPAAPGKWLIPDTPIDYSALDRLDAEVDFRVDSIQAGGVNYTQVAGHTLLRDGKLSVDPLLGTMPGGPAGGRLTLDSRAPDAPFSLYVNAPSLQLAQLAATFGDHLSARGTVNLLADLQGAGRTPHAIAGSLNGYIGIGSVDSEIDNRLLLALIRLAKLPEVPMSASGTSKLRCFAVRLSAVKGVATVDAMVVDLLRLAVLGGGTIDLGQEQLALQLRPLLRLGTGAAAPGIVVPIRLAGSFRDPKSAVDLAKLGPAILGAGVADPCGPAIAAVNGTATAAAAAKAKPAATAAPKPEAAAKPGAAVSPLDVLKELIK